MTRVLPLLPFLLVFVTPVGRAAEPDDARSVGRLKLKNRYIELNAEAFGPTGVSPEAFAMPVMADIELELSRPAGESRR